MSEVKKYIMLGALEVKLPMVPNFIRLTSHIDTTLPLRCFTEEQLSEYADACKENLLARARKQRMEKG